MSNISVQRHFSNKSKVHTVVPIEEFISTLNYPKCPNNLTKQCKLHCKQPICTGYISFRKYFGHEMVDIVKYMYLEVRKKFWKKICKKYKNQFSPDMNRKHQISRSSKHSQKLKAELKKQREALHREIDIIIHSRQA